MTKFHLFSLDSVRLETAPTGGVRKSYIFFLRDIMKYSIQFCALVCLSDIVYISNSWCQCGSRRSC